MVVGPSSSHITRGMLTGSPQCRRYVRIDPSMVEVPVSSALMLQVLSSAISTHPISHGAGANPAPVHACVDSRDHVLMQWLLPVAGHGSGAAAGRCRVTRRAGR